MGADDNSVRSVCVCRAGGEHGVFTLSCHGSEDAAAGLLGADGSLSFLISLSGT